MNTTNERYKLNKELAQMLKGGVIMDVTTPEQAKIAEAAGACAVMALERIPADIRPENDPGHPECCFYPGYGKMPYRTFRGGSGSRSDRNRLH